MTKFSLKQRGFSQIVYLVVILLVILIIVWIYLHVLAPQKPKASPNNNPATSTTLSLPNTPPNLALPNQTPQPSASTTPSPSAIINSAGFKQAGPSPSPVSCSNNVAYEFNPSDYHQFWTDLLYPQNSQAPLFSVSNGALTTSLPQQKFTNNVSTDYNNVVAGDFEATVEMDATIGGDGNNNAGDQMVFHNDTWSNQFIIGLRRSDKGTNVFAGVSLPPNGWNELGTAVVTTPVTVKLAKSGQKLTFSYLTGGSFSPFATFTDSSGLDQGHIALQAFSNSPDFPTVNGSFKHFTLSCH